MPHPIEVFDNPTTHWQLLTAPHDAELEEQHFGRKEDGTPFLAQAAIFSECSE
jgi:hypothetical protein